MTTGERIKDARKRLGLSAEKLTAMINVSPATVYRWEKGDIEKVPAQMLEPIADALQTTPEYLMGWEKDPDQTNEPSLLPSKKQQLFSLLSQVPDEKADQLIHILKSVLEYGEE